MTLDVFTVGEAMLRLSVLAGQDFERSAALQMDVGGAEANTAAVLAGLGRTAVWHSRLPESVLGHRVERELRSFGVDTSTVRWDHEHRLGLYFVQFDVAPMAPRVTYDRRSSAASRMGSDEFPWDTAGEARVIYVSGITPALSASCESMTTDLALFARDRSIPFVFDVNFRSKLWRPEQAAAVARRVGELAEAVLLTVEDARDLFGVTGEPLDVAREIHGQLQSNNVVLTLGALGAVWHGEAGTEFVPGLRAEVIDAFGAGDAFAAGVVDGLLDGDLAGGVARGTALGALAVTRSGDLLHVRREDLDRVQSERDIER